MLKSIKEKIKLDLERINKIIQNLENSLSFYSSDDIISSFKLYLKEYSLFNFMEMAVRKKKEAGHLRTAETYLSTLLSFKNFRNGIDIHLDSIDSEVVSRYEAFLRSRNVSQNTLSFYMRVLRAVYNRAVDEGAITQKYPFKKTYTGIGKTVKRALPISEIRKIKKLDLSLKPALDYARDMFMLSFYLRGISIIDMAFLEKKDLRRGRLYYKRRKTGQNIEIKWTEEMQNILNKYATNPTRFLIPLITETSDNERRLYRNKAFMINRKLKIIAKTLNISTPLTLYVARHSWASIARSKGIPLSVISEGMGHDSESTTRIYLASLDTTMVDKANNLIIKSL